MTGATSMPSPNHQPDESHEEIQQRLAHVLVDGWLRWGRENQQEFQDTLCEVAEKVFDDDAQFIAENTSPPSAPIAPPVTLPPLADLEKIVARIYCIYINVERKQEGLNLFGKLQRGIGHWADWQAQQASTRGDGESTLDEVRQGAD